MGFEMLTKLSKVRGKRTRERLRRTATYLLNPERKSLSEVTNREKKSHASSLKHPYPYVEEVRELVAPESKYLDDFCLVGENWKNKPDAPILPVFGCNDWKYGFLADYFPEYRVAFAPRKISGFKAKRLISRFACNIGVVAIWGKTESRYFSRYLGKTGIDIWRIEDGFVRSAELGAAHSTPYSLAIDKSGIYYDPNSESELEKILNTYDFDKDPELLTQADSLRRLIIDNRLSKYNPPASKSVLDIKVRRRVAVLGQVDSDASIKFGNPKRWTSLELIKLAYHENPGAEIIYRPHPEVFRGYQKSNIKRKQIKTFATIANPDSSFVDFIDSVDHCYTISSLSGFEALVRGKKVTLVGVPFYAGWGLTDDRVDITNRGRRLDLNEIFAGAYLLYPKYLGDLNNSYNGMLSACYRIKADQEVLLFERFKKSKGVELVSYVDGFFWSGAMFRETDEAVLSKILKTINFGSLVSSESEEMGVRALVFYCLGQLNSVGLVEMFLKSIRSHLNPYVFNRILITLSPYVSEKVIEKNINWLVANVESVCNANTFFGKRYGGLEEYALHEEAGISSDFDIELMCENLDQMIALRSLKEAQDIAELLLIKGANPISTLRNYLTICELKFNFESSLLVAEIIYGIDPLYANRISLLAQFRNRKSLGQPDLLSLDWLSKFLLYRPDQIVGVKFAIGSVFSEYESDRVFNLLLMQCRLDRDLSYRKIRSYVELEQFEKAEVDAKLLIASGDNSDNARILLSQILSYQGRVDEALSLMLESIRRSPTTSNISEVLRLYILRCDYRSSMETYRFALTKGVSVGEMHRRKLFFGNRMIEDALLTFRDLSVKKNLVKYYSQKYLDLRNFEGGCCATIKSLCAIAIFGPGDEIRFASIYNDLLSLVGAGSSLSITVTPRLKTLFSRSFPMIEFIETPRPRNSDPVDYSDYSKVPGSDLVSFINDAAVRGIDKADSVAMVTDFLGLFRRNYEEFPGRSYLKVDKGLQRSFRNRLPSDKILVGVSWRSSLSTAGRNEHYLSINELATIFGVAGVQFVNLQYDECSSELEWCNEHYPGKVLNFEDLDQYNDFDGVAALMSCLDLVISPATTVIELAGALGVNSWLFSNSSEIDWRKKDDLGTDVWHSSVTIVDVDKKGNKQALISAIGEKLESFVSKYEPSGIEV